MRQIKGLQILRAVAVLLVTAGHVGQMTMSGPTVRVNLIRASNLSMFGVDIFFAISGFILGSTALRAASGNSRVEAYDFIARRIIRIFPIYWIVILFPLSRALRQHTLTGYKLFDYWFLLPGLSYPATPLIIGLAWTLIFEMVFYYIMTAFMRFTLRHAVRNTILALLLVVTVGALVDIRRPVLIVLMNPILLEFALGGLSALAFRRFGTSRKLGVGLLIAGLIGTAVLTVRVTYNVAIEQYVLTGRDVLLRAATWGIAAWLLVSGVVFWEPQVTSGIGKILVAIGNGSYSIYLTSAVSIEMITRFLAMTPIGRLMAEATTLWGIIALGCVVLLGMAFYWFIERPIGKYLNSLYNSTLREKWMHAHPRATV
jgi:exopolysaccharide production protein ExoZ